MKIILILFSFLTVFAHAENKAEGTPKMAVKKDVQVPVATASPTPFLVTPEVCKKVTPILHRVAAKCLTLAERPERCKCYDAVAVKMEVKYKNCHGMFEEIKQDIADRESAKAEELQQKSCFSK